MAKAKQLSSGSWRVLLFVGMENGKRKYESFTAPTKAEAEILANQRKVDLERGKEAKRTPQDMTVDDAMKQYISLRSAVLSPSTIRAYETMRKFYLQGIAKVKIRNLTQAMLQAEINREAQRLSPKSLRNYMGFFVPAISDVCDKHYDVKLPQKKPHEIVVPEDDVMLRIFEEAKGKKIEIPILLAATAGLRRGEIGALDLSKDIDYEKHTVSVTKDKALTADATWVVKQPKTPSSFRTVQLPEWVCDIIKERVDSGYSTMNPQAIGSAFRRLSCKLGIDIRFHDLRHYYASTMLKLGVPDIYAMKRMGHSTTHMLKSVYQHIMRDKDDEVSEIMTKHFDEMQHKMQHEKP